MNRFCFFPLVVIIICLFTQNSTAQISEDQEVNISVADNTSNFAIGVMPLSLIDPFAPRLRLSAQYRTGIFGFNIDVAGMAYGDGPGYGNPTDYRVIELRPEVKFYFNDALDMDYDKLFYMSMEGQYLHHVSRVNDVNISLEEDSIGGTAVFGDADFKRTKISGGTKLGMEFFLSDNFSLDAYAGLGIGTREVEYSNISVQIERDTNDFFNNFYENEGTVVVINFLLGVRLMYNF